MARSKAASRRRSLVGLPTFGALARASTASHGRHRRSPARTARPAPAAPPLPASPARRADRCRASDSGASPCSSHRASATVAAGPSTRQPCCCSSSSRSIAIRSSSSTTSTSRPSGRGRGAWPSGRGLPRDRPHRRARRSPPANPAHEDQFRSPAPFGDRRERQVQGAGEALRPLPIERDPPALLVLDDLLEQGGAEAALGRLATGGPPSSRQTRTSAPSSTRPSSVTTPPGTASAPCLAAFVASSCRISTRSCTGPGRSATSSSMRR